MADVISFPKLRGRLFPGRTPAYLHIIPNNDDFEAVDLPIAEVRILEDGCLAITIKLQGRPFPGRPTRLRICGLDLAIAEVRILEDGCLGITTIMRPYVVSTERWVQGDLPTAMKEEPLVVGDFTFDDDVDPGMVAELLDCPTDDEVVFDVIPD